MKRVIAVVIGGLFIAALLLVSLFGMQLSGAYVQVVQTQTVQLASDGAYRTKPLSELDRSIYLKIPYDPTGPYKKQSIIVTWEVFPSNATYKELSFYLTGIGQMIDPSSNPTDPKMIDIVTVDNLGFVFVNGPIRTFTVYATTVRGIKITTQMEVHLTGVTS